MEDIKLRKFQFIVIDEKRTWLNYDGVEKKDPRPFLVVRPSMYGRYFIACPITDVKTFQNADKNMRKSYLKIKFNDQESYVKMNFPLIFPFSHFEDKIAIPIDAHLNKSLRGVAIQLLKESFDD